MKYKLIFCAISVSFLFASFSCVHSENDSKKQQAEQALQMHISNLEKRIEQLEKKSESFTGKSKDFVNTVLDDLQAQLDKAKDEFDELEDASTSTWISAKERVDEEITELNSAYNKAIEIFTQ